MQQILSTLESRVPGSQARSYSAGSSINLHLQQLRTRIGKRSRTQGCAELKKVNEKMSNDRVKSVQLEVRSQIKWVWRVAMHLSFTHFYVQAIK